MPDVPYVLPRRPAPPAPAPRTAPVAPVPAASGRAGLVLSAVLGLTVTAVALAARALGA